MVHGSKLPTLESSSSCEWGAATSAVGSGYGWWLDQLAGRQVEQIGPVVDED